MIGSVTKTNKKATPYKRLKKRRPFFLDSLLDPGQQLCEVWWTIPSTCHVACPWLFLFHTIPFVLWVLMNKWWVDELHRGCTDFFYHQIIHTTDGVQLLSGWFSLVC